MSNINQAVDVSLIIDGKDFKSSNLERIFETRNDKKVQGADVNACSAAVASCNEAFKHRSLTTPHEGRVLLNQLAQASHKLSDGLKSKVCTDVLTVT